MQHEVYPRFFERAMLLDDATNGNMQTRMIVRTLSSRIRHLRDEKTVELMNKQAAGKLRLFDSVT